MRDFLIFLGLLLALVCSACGANPGSAGTSGPQSTVTVVINGDKFEVQGEVGTITGSSYSGPEGCKGRYFTLGRHSQVTLRYSSRDAYVIYNSFYHFTTGPRRQAGKLAWDHTFGADHVQVTVAGCPAPPPSGPLLPPAGTTTTTSTTITTSY